MSQDTSPKARLNISLALVRVVAPHFVAGFETDGIVRRAAPIIKYMEGRTDEWVRNYIASKGWRAGIVPDVISGTSQKMSGAETAPSDKEGRPNEQKAAS